MRPLWISQEMIREREEGGPTWPPLGATGRTTGGARSRRWRLSGSRPRRRTGGRTTRTTGPSGEAGTHSRRWGAGEPELPLRPWPAAARTTGTARLELPVMVAVVMVAVAAPEYHRGGKEQGRCDEDDSGDNYHPGGDAVEPRRLVVCRWGRGRRCGHG
ncbi:MAG: hypothetical protein QOI86_75 [Actinomycetota bacterium]|nr:hypothetical protein [Actinomycetota bacterium]